MRALLLAVTLCAVACAKPHEGSSDKPAQSAQPFKELTVEQLEEKLAGTPKPVVFDANPREVYDKRHVPGAIWMPVDDVTADKLPKDKSTPLVFYCASPH